MSKKPKRKYTMSAAARDQRRAAPWKTGTRARSVIAQTVPPCKPSLCPLTDPEQRGQCVIKRAMADQNRNLEACPVQLVVNEGTRGKILAAIELGDLSGTAELAANLLAGMHHLGEKELAQLQGEGLSVERAIVTKDGEIAGYVAAVNPRAEPLIKILDMLGATATQQAITPKSSGERKRDEGIGGALDFYRTRALMAGGELQKREG